MIRVFKHYIPTSLVLLAVLEIAILLVSYQLAVFLRFLIAGLAFPGFGAGWVSAGVFAFTLYVVMLALGLYQTQTVLDLRVTFVRLLVAMVIAFLAQAVVGFLVPLLDLWRSISLIAFGVALLFIMVTRLAFSAMVDSRGFKKRVLVYGAGQQAKRVLDFHRDEGHRRFMIVGFVADSSRKPIIDGAVDKQTIAKLSDYARQFRTEEIVVALDERRGALPVRELLDCKMRGITITDQASFFEREMGYVDLGTLQPSWLVFSDGFTRGHHIELWAKRLFDVVMSLLLLSFTMPVLILTAIAVKTTSRGPIFYRQERVGLRGDPFELFKFRSMSVDAEASGAQWAQKNDPRVTPVGGFLRLTRIDEVPQVINVLKGDMSFVGPRPERPVFVKELEEEIEFFAERHTVKPGITGWAQLNYPYGASVEDARRKLEFDLYYIKNYSIFLDFLIILQTVRVVLFPDGAR